MQRNGIAIAIAWPETLCKQSGAWYDPLLNKLGVSKNHYYKVGHAALVLVNKESGKCYYFDFGRYHSPFQHGRVRDANTDHDLEIHTKALFNDKGNLKNYKEILRELLLNPSCHGDGDLHASYCEINFHSALRKAKHLQDLSPLPYGPFVLKGTNCSRFVNTVILAGKTNWYNHLKLMFPRSITPAPITNVKALGNYIRLNRNFYHSASSALCSLKINTSVIC